MAIQHDTELEQADAVASPSVNWRGAVLTISIATLCIAFFQFLGEPLFQWGRGYRWIASEISFWIGLVVLIFWMGVTSRFPPRVRLIGAVVPIALLTGFFALFQFKRDGDLTPYRIVPRWNLSLAVVSDEDIRAGDTAKPTPGGSEPSSSSLNLGPDSAIGQFLGPDRTGIVRGVTLRRDWDRHPPRELWRQPIGGGFSSFAVCGDYLFTQELRGKREFVSSYELLTGKPVWRTKSPGLFKSNWTGDGPRATPTITQRRLYSVGGEGRLICLDAETGEMVWTRHVHQTVDAENTRFGKSGSPLLIGDRVIVTGGGERGPSLLAFDKTTGELDWTAAWGPDPQDQGTIYNSYASPVAATLHGTVQIVNLEDKGVAAYHPETGRQLWTFDWPWQDLEPKVSQPVILPGNRVFISAAYASGCAVFQIERMSDQTLQTELVWQNRNLRTKFSNVVVRDHYVYGLHDRILACVDLRSGERRWRGGRFGHGQILLVGELIVVVSEMGEVALVEAGSEQFRELGRFRALHDRTWNCPVIHVPRRRDDVVYLVLRNDQEAVCYELAREPPAARTTN